MRVVAYKFTVSSFRPIYDMDAIDLLLDEVVGLLNSGADGSELEALVTNAALPQRRWRPGYDIDQVNALLRALVAEAKDLPAA